MGNKRKLIVYIIFVLSSIYGVWFHFLSDQGSTSRRKPGPVTSEIQRPGRNPAVISSDSRFIVNKNRSAEISTAPDGWGRNPFSDHSVSGVANIKKDNSPVSGIPRLTAISYYDDEVSFAILDNKVVTAGDNIGPWTVLDIRKNMVVLKQAGRIENLTLGS